MLGTKDLPAPLGPVNNGPLANALARIKRKQRLDARSLEQSGEVDHRRRQLLRQKQLAAALDVLTAAALDCPSAAGKNPGHLVAPQIYPRCPTMAEAMPYESEAVRVDVEYTEAPGEYGAQFCRRRKQLCRALSLRTGQNVQKCSNRRVHFLPPTGFRFRQEH